MNTDHIRKTHTRYSGVGFFRLVVASGLAIALLTIAPFAGAATSFGPEQIISSTTDGAQSVFSIDIDGDGDTDAVSAALQGDEVAWYENDTGDGSSWVKRVIATVDNARAVHAVDIDGDGDADVFSAAGNVVRWHKNDGASPPAWSSHTISSTVFSASDVWAGDIDGDGDIDAISSSLTTDNIYWYENTSGDGSTWSSHLVTNSLDFPQALDGADVDGDGDIDILAVAGGNTQNEIAWFENGNSWSEHLIFQVPPIYFPGLLSVHAVDIDSDGDIDVLASGYTPVNYGWIMLWTNTATTGNPPVWSRSVIDTNPGDAVIAADLDGDGDPDVIKTNRFSNDVSWYENLDGLGITWNKTTIGTASGGRDVFAGDVDGDGDFDILSASSNDDTVAWYENAPAPPATYTVGGNLSGLSGSLTLQNNGADDLALGADGVFTFATALMEGSPYLVTVSAPPVGQTCSVTGGSGTVATADITNVVVSCVADPVPTYTVGGNLSGLSGSLTLQNNGADDLALGADGVFTFATALMEGSPYLVTVSAPPVGQTCSVTGGSGTVATADITNVVVSCVTDPVPTYTVGGNLSGLSGSLTLQNNGADDLALGADGVFTFATALMEGSPYLVTVSAPPVGQTCSVTGGSGTVATADITNVVVSCVTDPVPTYTVGGNLSGLSGSLTLQNNGADDLALGADGVFTFATALMEGSPYLVTVSAPPVGQTCSVTGGSGTVATADVTNVSVACIDDVVAPPPVPMVPIPTLSQWALILLTMLLGLMVFANRRRLF